MESSTLFRSIFDEQEVHRFCRRLVQFLFFFPCERGKERSREK